MELDLASPEGMIASWENLVAIYGFDHMIELFKIGLTHADPETLWPHLDALSKLLEGTIERIVAAKAKAG
jgi:hypothetical protein